MQDEISEFASTCIINPPAPRDLQNENIATKHTNGGHAPNSYNKSGTLTSHGIMTKKRKLSLTDADVSKAKMIRTNDGFSKISSVPPRKGIYIFKSNFFGFWFQYCGWLWTFFFCCAFGRFDYSYSYIR